MSFLRTPISLSYHKQPLSVLEQHEIYEHMNTLCQERKFSAPAEFINSANLLAAHLHSENVQKGWWTDLSTMQPKERNFGELMALVMSEILEGRTAKTPWDDKLQSELTRPVELADALIRQFDMFGAYSTGASGEFSFGESLWFCDAEDSIDEAWLAAFEWGRKGKNPVGHLAQLFNAIILESQRHGYELPRLLAKKQQFNRSRADHKISNRLADGGKKM